MALKGYVVMIDAFLALALTGFIMLLLIHQGVGNPTTSWHQVRIVSRDFLDYSAATGVLEASVLGDSETGRLALLLVPPQYCSVLSVYSSNGTLLTSVSRPDCESIQINKMVAYKPFVYEGNSYIASLSSWYS